MACKYCGLGGAHVGMYGCGTVYMGARINALLDEKAALKSRVEGLEGALALLQTRYDATEPYVKGLETQVEELEERRNMYRSDCSAACAERDELKAEAKEMRGFVDTAAGSIAHGVVRCSKAEADLSEAVALLEECDTLSGVQRRLQIALYFAKQKRNSDG